MTRLGQMTGEENRFKKPGFWVFGGESVPKDRGLGGCHPLSQSEKPGFYQTLVGDSEQAMTHGHGDGLSAIANVQFLEDIREFAFDSGFAPVQPFRNLPVGSPFGH